MSSISFQANRAVAVFGGSFDPLHVGHVEFVNKLITELNFKKVIIVPCKQHPFEKKFSFSDENRLKMLSNVFSKNKNIEICDFEIHSKETSFTIHTLTFLKKTYAHLTFVCGTDAFEKIESWNDYKNLFKLADFLVVKRSGIESNLNELTTRLDALNIKNIEFIDLNLPNISSTEIKTRINQGESLEGLLPKENRDIKKI